MSHRDIVRNYFLELWDEDAGHGGRWALGQMAELLMAQSAR
jgi:hypothetical protein